MKIILGGRGTSASRQTFQNLVNRVEFEGSHDSIFFTANRGSIVYKKVELI